jgi:hypothetical protein
MFRRRVRLATRNAFIKNQFKFSLKIRIQITVQKRINANGEHRNQFRRVVQLPQFVMQSIGHIARAQLNVQTDHGER